MERAEFISKFGLGLVAVCAGCGLVSCGSGDVPIPSSGGVEIGGATPPPLPGSGNLFTIDLSTQLTNIGTSTVQKGVILVRIGSGDTPASFTAVQVSCTHQATAIGYSASQHLFICPGHGSQFSNSGTVVQGPAASSLHQYMVSIDNSGILTVSA